MRVLVACVVSFAVALIVGGFMLSGMVPHFKAKPVKRDAPDTLSLEMLPALPSLRATRREGMSDQYAQAWRLLKAGQYRAAESAYLQILMGEPHDRKAIGGLVTARRLRANQDPQKLQEDAAGYRRAIVEGRTMEGNYTPREMELLAEASLSAAREIQLEESLRAGVPARTTASAPATRPAGWRRGNPAPTPASIVARRIPGVSSDARPHPVAQTVIATVVPESQASRPATPDGAPSPRPDVTPVSPLGNAAPEAYVLGTGDQIEVTVPHLAVTVTLGPDGVIALPLISPVKAAGKTTAQLASELTSMYAKVLDAPSVTVFVRQYRLNR
jgi:Polysaccharide biosynthesis/export protein